MVSAYSIRLQQLFRAIALLMLGGVAPSVLGNGIGRNGVSAESMSLGGTETGWAATPLGAMAANPAGLGFLPAAELDASLTGAIPQGHYKKSPATDGTLDPTLRAFPEGAFAYPFKKIPLTLAGSIVADSALVADWNYLDSPGGLGGLVSYGQQTHRSEILVLRPALGAGTRISPHWSFGVSIGAVYNENHLTSPYVFQKLSPNPNSLNGAKTLLDLHTRGFGWNAQAGLLFRATTNLQFGLAYKSKTKLNTTGDATGDPYAQFGVSPGPLAFRYDAEVDNTLPQELSLGASWKFHPHWRLALQVDWINWNDAFTTLPVHLSHGNNSAVNAQLGADFSDAIPLNWSDEFVYRAGVEFAATQRLSLRAGYCYGRSPVPDSTLTPLTATITEHTLTAGLGYEWRNCTFNLAYQYDLPVTRNIGTSSLLADEYSRSSTQLSLHWLAVTTNIRF